MTLDEAAKLALKVLKQVMEEKLNSTNVQLATVTKEKGFKITSDEDLKAYIDQL
jgi:20S proteasome subunit alpha 5